MDSSTSRAVAFAKRLASALVRRRTTVQFGDISRPRPVSARFGDDRGQPIDRYFIERFLREHASLITGEVMEIGGAQYTRMFGRDVKRSTVLHVEADGNATVIGDLTRPETLPASTVDCLICTQTLGCIFDVAHAIEGIHRVLRPGGVVLATVAGISQISRYDMERWGDYWRFTDASLRRLFARVFGDQIDVRSYGNVSATVAFLQGLAVEDLPDRSILEHDDPAYQLILTVIARRLDANPAGVS